MTLQRAVQLLGYENPHILVYPKENVDFSYIKKFPYIQVADYWFDNSDDPDENTWIDIEGMGYGYVWDANWFRRKSKFLQRRAIRKLAYDRLNLLLPTDKVFTRSKRITEEYFYGFMINECCYVEIRLSEDEINF